MNNDKDEKKEPEVMPESHPANQPVKPKKMPREEMVKVINSAQAEQGSAGGFHKVITSALDNEYLTEQDLCRNFSVLLKTVQDWRAGTLAPHPDFRCVIYRKLLQIVDPPKK